MATADTARLIASLELQDKFSKTADKALTKVDRIDKPLGAFTGAVNRNLARGVDAVISKGVRALSSSVTEGLGSLAELENATTAVDGAIAQMGKTGKVTSQQVATWANEIEAATQAAFDDKAITAATATLLRFGDVTSANIRPAMEVMTDLAVRTGDVNSAATQLGKALANPTKAAGKLTRVGVNLTNAQEKQIKAFVKAGETGEAQAVILDAVAKVTGGAAADSVGKYGDTLHLMADASEDAKKALAEGFFPVIQRVSSKITELANDPATLQRLRDFGTTLAGAFDKAVDVAEGIDWKSLGDGLKSAYDWTSKLFGAFMAAPAEVKGLIIGLAGLTKLTGGAPIKFALDLGKDAIGGLFGKFFDRGSSPANPLYVTATGLGGVGGAAGGGKLGMAGKALGGLAIVGELAAVVAVQQEVSSQNSAIASDIHRSLNEGLKVKTPAELQAALDGVNAGINEIQANPLNVLVAGSALDELKAMRASLETEMRSTGQKTNFAGGRGGPGGGKALADAVSKGTESTKEAVSKSQGVLDQGILRTREAVQESKRAVSAAVATGTLGTTTAARTAGANVSAATGFAASRIVGAVNAIPAPQTFVDVDLHVSSTSVTYSETQRTRSSTTGSRSNDNYDDHR